MCHRGLDDDDDVTALELLFELILLMLFVAVRLRSFETETDDDDDDTSRAALVLLLVTTRELTSFLSPVWTAVGGRIAALILMELLPKGTALFMKTGSELLLGFKGTATPPAAARRLVDIAAVRRRERESGSSGWVGSSGRVGGVGGIQFKAQL